MLDERQTLAAICNADLRSTASSIASGKLVLFGGRSLGKTMMYRIECVASTMTPHEYQKLYKLKGGWD